MPSDRKAIARTGRKRVEAVDPSTLPTPAVCVECPDPTSTEKVTAMTSNRPCPRLARALYTSLLLTSLASTGAQAATIDDWQSAASACTPIRSSTLSTAFIPTNGAYVRAPLAPAAPLVYVCNVLDSFATAVPTWKYMQLQYLDLIGGAVHAQLFQKSKATGAVVLLASAVSAAAGLISTVTVPVPAMNFAANSYHVVITLTPQTSTQVQAHMMTLTQ